MRDRYRVIKEKTRFLGEAGAGTPYGHQHFRSSLTLSLYGCYNVYLQDMLLTSLEFLYR